MLSLSFEVWVNCLDLILEVSRSCLCIEVGKSQVSFILWLRSHQLMTQPVTLKNIENFHQPTGHDSLLRCLQYVVKTTARLVICMPSSVHISILLASLSFHGGRVANNRLQR